MSREEYNEWFKAVPRGVCMFCHPDTYPQIILKDEKNWQWIVTIAPYWKHHTMLIPKKHYEDINEIPAAELVEMVKLYEHAKQKYLAANLKYDDGVPIYQYNMFWRTRTEEMPKVTGIYKPLHFHLHIAPDREELFVPIMDKNARDFDYSIFIGD